jgi:hypothetical protein
MASELCPIDFLIVGAMKAGTTTLYRDLITHPDIVMPEQKEPETLVRFTSLADIRRDYAALFAKAPEGAIRGEASTAYTKLPIHTGAAERARDLSGGKLRIVYIRRDPVDRIISHYRHERQHRRIKLPISRALREVPELIDFSRYDWQIAPWKECFGEEQVLEIDLETYAADRRGVSRQVVAHLGADPDRLPPPDDSLVANSAGEMKRIDNPLLDRFVRSLFYQRSIKPAVPRPWREATRRTILPRAEPIAVELSPADREFIAKSLAAPEPSHGGGTTR